MENLELTKDMEELSERELDRLFADFEYTKDEDGYVLTGIKRRNAAVEVKIPYGVVRIAENAFRLCNNLREITIPPTLTKFDKNAFWGCPALNAVNIEDISAWCESTFAGENSNPLQYAQHLYKGAVRQDTLVIPDTVRQIADHAFSGCVCLEKLYISGDVTRIGKNAFSECKYLTEVSISGNVTVIDEEAFRSCNALKTVHLPYKLEVIGDFAFRYCYSLESAKLPPSLKSIGTCAFDGCTHLAELTFQGDKVEQIGKMAFEDCYRLERVNIPSLADWCKIKFVTDGYDTASPVYYSKGLYIDGAPVTDAQIPEGVSSICERAFFNNKTVKTVTVPPTVEQIGDDAFLECTNLERVYVTDLAAWCRINFVGRCWSNPLETAKGLYVSNTDELLADITVPEGTDRVSPSAFYGYKALKSISLPEGLKVIGEFAFKNCSSLQTVTLPSTIERIEPRAFEDADSIKTIRFRGTKKQWKKVEVASVFEYLSYEGKKKKEKTNTAFCKAKVIFDWKD